MEQMAVIFWSVVIWHLPLFAPHCADDFAVAASFLLCSTACKCSLPWTLLCSAPPPNPNTCRFTTTRRDPPRWLRATDPCGHRSFNRLATNTRSISKSTPRRCGGEARAPLYHTSTLVNLLLCAIYNIHPCGWLTSQNCSIFPEKQLHDEVVSVMFRAVTD